MADTLYTIHIIATDPDFTARLNAGAAQQDAPGDPATWVYDNRYHIAAAPSWAEKVDYWAASNPDGGNGWALDQAVISDADIIAQIQAMLGIG